MGFRSPELWTADISSVADLSLLSSQATRFFNCSFGFDDSLDEFGVISGGECFERIRVKISGNWDSIFTDSRGGVGGLSGRAGSILEIEAGWTIMAPRDDDYYGELNSSGKMLSSITV